MQKLKVLFFNKNRSGVNYYRTVSPAIHLDKHYNKVIDVTINSDFDPISDDGVEYLKKFDIVHYHSFLTPSIPYMIKLTNDLKNSGVKLILDIDDYWEVDSKHPKYKTFKSQNLKEKILTSILTADYITTTTEILAKDIKKITQKENVVVLPNSIDIETMQQFKPNKIKDDVVRIMYLGSSIHEQDLEQLEGVVNMLNLDVETKNKFKFINVGWDMGGTFKDYELNKNFVEDIKQLGLWNNKFIKLLNKSKGNLDMIPYLNDEIKEKYKNNVYIVKNRPVKPEEIPYYKYEQIFTDNYRIIDDKDYLKWLKLYKNEKYSNEVKYARRWTKPSNEYAKYLDEADIIIAPLKDTPYNKRKSNLKMVEAWSRKLPVVCSDLEPYNIDGENMVNCILIPNKINNKKFWYRELKKLILDETLRKKIGETLYKDFSKKYNLNNVNALRVELYNKVKKYS